MKTDMLTKAVILSVAVAVTTGFLSAQAGRGIGRLGGVCLDMQDNPLESIAIKLVFSQNDNLKYEAVSNKKGEWSVIGLGTGNWKLTATGEGYNVTEQTVFVTQLEANPKVIVKMTKITRTNDLVRDDASMGLLDKGNQLFRDQKYDEAIAQYEQFLEKNPDAYMVRINIGDCYREKGDYEKATAIYNELLERSKTDASRGPEIAAKVLAGLGNVMLKQNKLKEAQDYFKQSIVASPKDEILAYNVGEIYFANQGMDEAVKYFELASQIKPEWPDPYLKLGYVYLNKGDNAGAAAKFEKFLTLEPAGERAALVKNILGVIKR